MKVKSYQRDGVEVVEARGKFLGGADTGELDERLYALLGRQDKKVVIDLAHADYMNSSGIAILIHHWKKFNDIGGNLKLANLTKNIEKILVISKLTTVFETYDTLDEAIASFKNAPAKPAS
ncbi:MAG: STAS domain-containing protein [candidate division Zixibacteria bacterium]|nr:STAS domain-containing protein [candidate division Zixibacteria bacterium]